MLRRNSFLLAAMALFLACGLASAQDWGGPGRGPVGVGGPPMVRAFHDRHFGRWWNNPMLAQKLNISAAQKQKMDGIYEQYRLRLIDLNASLEKQQVLLEPMISADHPDHAKTLSQIDAVVNARAALEKENADMLFAIRETLTADQWQKLKALRREHWERRHGPHGPVPRWRQGMNPPPGQAAPPPPPDAQPVPPSGQTPAAPPTQPQQQ